MTHGIRASHGASAAFFLCVLWLVGCGDVPEAEDRVVWHHGSGAARGICVTTQYTNNISAYAELAVQNHVAYAERHGYTHVSYRGRPGPDFRDPARGNERHGHGGGLYWQKLGAMRQTLAAQNDDGTPRCRWAMWVDADIVFTNHQSRLEDIIAAFAPDDTTDVIVTREQAGFTRVQLNSGAFFVRNNAGGKRFVAEVSETFHTYKNTTYPDQDAITDYVALHDMHRDGPLATWRTARLRSNIALAPQRAFNAFAGRFDHFISDAQWQPCDFIAHITGATTQDRVLRMSAITAAARACTQPAPLYKELLRD